MKHMLRNAKWIAISVLFCLVLLALAACGEKEPTLSVSPYNEEGAISSEIELSMEPIWAELPDRLSVWVRNKTEETLTYVNDWSLEFYEDGVWKTIPFKGIPEWNTISRTTEPHSNGIFSVDFTMLDFSFPNGSYRIVKDFGGIVAAEEFKIGETVENMPLSEHGTLPKTANGMSVRTEFPVYKSTDSSVELIFENDTGETLGFDASVYLEYLSDGVWLDIPLRPGEGWNALWYESNGVGSVTCYFRKHAFNFPDGTYRLVKELNGMFYGAEFEIGNPEEALEISPHGTLPASANGVSLTAEGPVRVKVDWEVTLHIQNTTDSALGYTNDLDVEYLYNGTWRRISVRPESLKDLCYEQHDEWGSLTLAFKNYVFAFYPGTYRIVKDIDGTLYAAEFTVE